MQQACKQCSRLSADEQLARQQLALPLALGLLGARPPHSHACKVLLNASCSVGVIDEWICAVSHGGLSFKSPLYQKR